MPDLISPRFVGWQRVPQGHFVGRWRPVVTRDTEKDAWEALRAYQATEHQHRDLAVLPEGRKP